MWDVIRLNPIGGFSLRKIALSFVAVFSAALLWAVVDAPSAYANAEWDGDRVSYERQRYDRETSSIPGVPAGATAYVYKQPDQGLAHVIYFEPGVNIEDATGAKHMVVGFSPPSSYSSPQEARDIQITPKSAAADRSFGTTGRLDNDQGEVTNCAITGIGWLICPTARFIATGMDWLYDQLIGFIEVQPLSFDTSTPLYRMWSIMRGIANIAFVIAFLIIIYAQVTGGLLSNYSLKKMLPRLIIAAILVNVSYVICAFAVDLSNILGYNLQQMFMDLRYEIVGADTEANTLSWENTTAHVLSGGTTIIGGLIGAKIAAGTIAAAGTAAIYLLFPFLLGVILAVMVALLVLAARQALIVMLIVLAPLAFVAYLLPNTEKWFDKWKDSFLTMMLLFPIFSVIFGGAQLAGNIIIQTARDIYVVIFGMFVMVAPVVITPLLVKFSGGLLGRLAGIVNNPNKGLLDRTRNWSNDQVDRQKKRRLGQAMADRARGVQSRRSFMRNYALRKHESDHEKDQRTKNYESAIEKYTGKEYLERLNNMDDQGRIPGELSNNRVFGEYSRRANRRTRGAHAAAYGAEMGHQAATANDERQREEAKAGQNAGVYSPVNDYVKQTAQDISVQNMAAQSAKRIVNNEIANALEHTVELQKQAAGIDVKFGASRAIASAIETRVNDRSAGLKAIETMLAVQNPSRDEIFAAATGAVPQIKGIELTREVREVAIKQIAGGGDIGQIHELAKKMDFWSTDENNEFWRTAFVDALRANSNKPAEFSATLLENMSQARLTGFGQTGLDKAFLDAADANAFDAAGIIKNDKDTIERLRDAIQRNPSMLSAKAQQNLQKAVYQIVANDNYRGAVGKRKDAIVDLSALVGTPITRDDL